MVMMCHTVRVRREVRLDNDSRTVIISYVIYFSSLRLKMAARDGDRPVWPTKQWPWQIPLFIHKLLDPLGLCGRVVRLADTCVCVCVVVVAVKEYVCMHRGVSVELKLNLCVG